MGEQTNAGASTSHATAAVASRTKTSVVPAHTSSASTSNNAQAVAARIKGSVVPAHASGANTSSNTQTVATRLKVPRSPLKYKVLPRKTVPTQRSKQGGPLVKQKVAAPIKARKGNRLQGAATLPVGAGATWLGKTQNGIESPAETVERGPQRKAEVVQGRQQYGALVLPHVSLEMKLRTIQPPRNKPQVNDEHQTRMFRRDFIS